MQRLNSSLPKVALFLSVASILATTLHFQSRGGKVAPTPPTNPAPSRVVGSPISFVTSDRLKRSPAQFSVSTKCYIPARGRLREREVASQIVEAQSRATGNRTPLLNEVIRLAPRYFPPGARVSESHQGDEEFIINLNRAFFNETFWRGRTRRDTLLALHALARNIAFINYGKGISLARALCG